MKRASIRYNIYLTFDADTEARLQTLQKQLVAEVPGLPPVEGKMAPHLSLLVFDDERLDSVIERFARFALDARQYSISLTDIRAFNRRSPVLYVSVLKSDILMAEFSRCHNLFQDSAIVSTCRSEQSWIPHITLAKRMSRTLFEQAEIIAKREFKPQTAHICGLELIDVQKPLNVLASKAL